MNTLKTPLTTKKYLIQKIAKVLSVISIIAALVTVTYIFVFSNNEELKLTLGVVAFFFSSMAVVLYAIAVANLPDLSLKKEFDK